MHTHHSVLDTLKQRHNLTSDEVAVILAIRARDRADSRKPTAHGHRIGKGEFDLGLLQSMHQRGLVVLVCGGVRRRPKWVRLTWHIWRPLHEAGL